MHLHWSAEDSHFNIHDIKNVVYYSESSLKLLQLYVYIFFIFFSTYFHNNQLYRYIFSDNHGKLEKGK